MIKARPRNGSFTGRKRTLRKRKVQETKKLFIYQQYGSNKKKHKSFFGKTITPTWIFLFYSYLIERIEQLLSVNTASRVTCQLDMRNAH